MKNILYLPQNWKFSFVAKRKENTELSRKVSWILYVVLFSIVPYIIRFGYYCMWTEDVPSFYISELDIFLFCISVTVALFSELKHLTSLPLDLGSSEFYGILMLYIAVLFGGVFFSLDFEHRIIVLKNSCTVELQNNKSISGIVKLISQMERKKFSLFLISILLSIVTLLLSYKTIFKKNG